MFVFFQGIAPENSWLESISLKEYKIIWKINAREMKTKFYLENLINTMDKMERDGGNKAQ